MAKRRKRRSIRRYSNPWHGVETAGLGDIGELADLGGVLKEAVSLDEVKASALLAASGGAGFALGVKALKSLIDPADPTSALARNKDYVRAIVAFLGGHLLRVASRRAGGMISVIGDGFGAGLAIAAGAHVVQKLMNYKQAVLDGVDEDKLLTALSDLGTFEVPAEAWGTAPAIAGADYEELPIAALEADVAPVDELDGVAGADEGYPLEDDLEADVEAVDGLV